MARRSKKNTVKTTEITLKGVPQQGHPRWGAKGRPILIGDTARHAAYGKCNVKSLDGSKARIKVINSAAEHNVHVQELTREVTAVEGLVEAERWEA